jgi:hypothetical protein
MDDDEKNANYLEESKSTKKKVDHSVRFVTPLKEYSIGK